MGLLLNILASFIIWITRPALYLICSAIALCKGEFGSYNRVLAISKDQYGNVLGQYVFNLVFIKKGGYKYGHPDETISSVTGKNKRGGTLTWAGKALDFIFEILDENHSLESIEENP